MHPKVLSAPRARIWMAVGAAAVLLVGAALAPRNAPPQSVPTEAPGPALQEVVERREALSVFREIQTSAADVLPFAVTVLPEGAPPVHGVHVGAGRIATSPSGVGGGWTPMVRLADGSVHPGRLETLAAAGRVAWVRIDPRIAPPAPPRAASPAVAGDVAFAAAHDAEGALVAPVFLAGARVGRYAVSGALPAFAGAPVFNLDGELLGVLEAGGTGVMRFDR